MTNNALLVACEPNVKLKAVASVLEREIKSRNGVFRSVTASATMAEQKRLVRDQFAGELIKIEVANKGFINVGTFFGTAQSLLKLLFQQVAALFFRLNRLAKNRVAPTLLLVHRLRGFIQIAERFRTLGGSVGDYRPRLGVNFQHRATARTRHFKWLALRSTFRHGEMIPQAQKRMQSLSSMVSRRPSAVGR
jgi:hypothetical protein